MEIRQYQIVLVNLEPSIGVEMKKTRPCVVISPIEMNRNLQTIVIVPLTTQKKSYPTRVEVKHQKKKGWAVIDQPRCIDKRRVIKQFGALNEKEIQGIKRVLFEAYVA